jgi:hypothetical protein
VTNLEKIEIEKRVSLSRLKHSFSKKFPDSPLLPLILSLPDQIEPSELVGQALILLDLLDTESANNLDIQKKKGGIP